MTEHEDFKDQTENEIKAEASVEELDFNELFNMASGLLMNPVNAEEESDEEEADSFIIGESIDMNELLFMASQLMQEPNVLEQLSGLFNPNLASRQESSDNAGLQAIPINLPGIFSMLGGPTSGLSAPSSMTEPDSVILREISELQEQLAKINENISELREELAFLKNQHNANSLLDN